MRAALVAVAFLVAACVPDPAPSSPIPTDGGVAPGSLAPEICPIARPPGPGDEPPPTDETDTGDQGGGRAAVCLVGPPQVTWESTAWCMWTPDRIAVDDITGLPTRPTGDDAMWDAFLDLRASQLELSRTQPDGTVTTWIHEGVPAVIRDDGSDGLATLDAVLEPGAPPTPATPPRVAGVLRWQCASPPRPAPAPS